jgi:hypothetical protein
MTSRPLRSSRTRALLRSGTTLALLAGALLGGCSRPADLEDVALRLGPADFARPAPAQRTPVVQIGDEARPVIEQPATIQITEKHNVPVVNGVARIEAQLPPMAAALDDGAFVLTLRRDVAGETDEIAVGAAVLHYVRRDHGWRLQHDAADPRRIKIEIDEPGAAPGTILPAVRLQALAPVATTLVSRPFEVPPRARRPARRFRS